jgi:hypothetical protein
MNQNGAIPPNGMYANTGNNNKKKGNGKWVILGIVIVVVFYALVSLASGDDSESGKETNTKTEESSNKTSKTKKKAKTTKSKNESKKNWIKEYTQKGKKIYYLTDKYLYKNANKFVGKVVVSNLKISDVDGNTLKCDTSADNLFFDFVCDFKNSSEIKDVQEDKIATVIGTVESKASIGKSVTLNKCHLVDYDNAGKYKSKLKSGTSSATKEVKVKKKNAKSSYKASCKQYPYKKIQRKPDKYDGKKIKVSGKVIQVSEGWFDSVDLRVEDSSGNIWYVEYSYSDGESKILEDDKVTVYGECTGTESYTSVLGNSITIPSIDAKYIE